MDSETTKKLQFLIAHLAQNIEIVALRNRAYQQLAPQLAEKVSLTLTTPEYVKLTQQSNEIRRRVIEALASEDWSEIFGSLGELLGTLNRNQ